MSAPGVGQHGGSSSQDEDSEFTLASDFEIGHFFRERIVPRAVLYFTGEAIEDDDNVRAWEAPRPATRVVLWLALGAWRERATAVGVPSGPCVRCTRWPASGPP